MPEPPDPEPRHSSPIPRWLAALVLAALLGAAGWAGWLVFSNQLRGPS